MALVTFIEPNGTEHRAEIPNGWSLMKGAVHQGVPGIVAECGGACVCATCHIYIDPGWRERLPPMDSLERDTIEFALGVSADSRLSCQLTVAPAFDGLVVRVPAAQAG